MSWAILAALGLIAAACGGDPDDGPLAGEGVPTAVPTDQGVPTPNDGPHGSPLKPEMEPGRYTSAVLGMPVTFTTDVALELVEEDEGVIALRPPDGEPDDVLLLLRPNGVVVRSQAGDVVGGDNDTRVAAAPYPGSLGDYFTESPQVEVIRDGFQGETPWWELATSERADLVDACSLGARCTPLLSYGAADELMAIAEAGEFIIRVFEIRSPAGDPLLLVAQEQSGGRDLVATADSIVASWCFCGPTPPPTPTAIPSPPQPMTNLTPGDRVPAGTYLIDFPAVSLIFDFLSDIADVSVITIREGQGFALFALLDGDEELGTLVISDAELVAPAVTGKNPDRGPVDRAGDVDLVTWVASVETLAGVATGVEAASGSEVVWVDIEPVEQLVSDESTFACFEDRPEPPPGQEDARCVSLAQGTSGSSTVMVGNRVRVFEWPTPGLHAMVGANEVDKLDSAARVALGVLNGLTIALAAPPKAPGFEETYAEFLAEARAVPSEPELNAFCTAFGPWMDEPPPSNTPAEFETAVGERLALDERVTRLAPLEIRPQAELAYAGDLRHYAELAEYGFDFNAAPGSIFDVDPEVGEAFFELLAFGGENCST